MKVSAGAESRQLASASEVLDREEPPNLVTMFSEGNPVLELQVSTIDLTEREVYLTLSVVVMYRGAG